MHAAHDLVMVHEQHAIDRGMDVQLDGVGAAGLGRPERGPRVFELVARGAPVRDESGDAKVCPGRPQPPRNNGDAVIEA